jgi:hypothetical protein
MKHRFLVHNFNHTYLVVDITTIGLPHEILPVEGKPQNVPTLRFTTWDHAKNYFRGLGATAKAIETAELSLKRTGVGVLSIA